MLKQRVIATLIIKNSIVVQSIGFERYLPIGKPEIAIEALNDWGVDEIVVLDIDATKNKKVIDLKLIEQLASFSQVPLCVGGGIKTIEEIKQLLRSGADKVCINQTFLNNKNFILEASNIFGSQCIVVCLDVIKKEHDYFIYDYIKKESKDMLHIALEKAQNFGAGEILLNNVNNDGKKNGYDLNLINESCKICSLPIIALGGVGNPHHLKEGILIKNLSGVSAANFFHFTEHSVILSKSYLKKENNLPIRLETNIKYKDSFFDEDLRLAKKEDNLLDSLNFKICRKEII